MNTLSRIILVALVVSCCSNAGRYISMKTKDTMRDRFILDTISIENPLLVIYGGDLFVIRESYLDDFVKNPSYRPQGSGQQVFDIIPGYDRAWNMGQSSIPDGKELTDRVLEQLRLGSFIYDWRDYTESVVYKGIRCGVEIYEFDPKPSKFALELVIVPAIIPIGFEEFSKEERLRYLSQKDGYINKLDSLENSMTQHKTPRYVLTVEPLYSRETINMFIDKNNILIGGPGNERPYPKVTKRRVKKFGLPDL